MSLDMGSAFSLAVVVPPDANRIGPLVGMRNFTVVAALVIAVGRPTIAVLSAIEFGGVEMATSAGLARWFGRPD